MKLPLDERLQDAFGMLVQGLYFHATKQRFPDGCRFETRKHYPWDAWRIAPAFAKAAPTARVKRGAVFEYMAWWVDDDPSTSVWLLSFYERLAFSVSAVPAGVIPPSASSAPPLS